MPTELQSKIRKLAMTPGDDRRRAVQFTDPKHYTIRRIRVIVDGDCDFTEWGTAYEVVCELASRGRGWVTVGRFDSLTEADGHITEREQALDGDDCKEWVYCGIPCPEGFVP